MRSDRQRTGDIAEEAARRALLARGYRIRDRNFSCALGELDIIAEHDGRVVFVEVRSHSSEAYGAPRESVGSGKQRRVVQTAQAYLRQHRLHGRSVRFDVVEVTLDRAGRPQAVNVIENAFGAPPGSHV
jgi:putative endonuclease